MSRSADHLLFHTRYILRARRLPIHYCSHSSLTSTTPPLFGRFVEQHRLTDYEFNTPIEVRSEARSVILSPRRSSLESTYDVLGKKKQICDDWRRHCFYRNERQVLIHSEFIIQTKKLHESDPWCTLFLISFILLNSYLMHIHTQAVFTQSVCLKKTYHTMHSTWTIKTHKESVEMSCTHLRTVMENDSEKSE